jgi:hypothetical protein
MSISLRRSLPLAAVAAVLLLGSETVAQDASGQANVLRLSSPEAMPPATLEDVAWLAGHWQGEMFDGTAEALWSPPMGGSMMAAFRLVVEGRVTFYEMISIVEEDGSLVMKIKHFHPDLTGWEEKDDMIEFPLVKVTPNEVYFDGLTYRRTGADTREGFLLVRGASGIEEVRFEYRRVRRWEGTGGS